VITVFGSSGMHMILKGSVVTVHNPHIYHPKTSLQDFKKECANNKYNLDDTKSPSVVVSRIVISAPRLLLYFYLFVLFMNE